MQKIERGCVDSSGPPQRGDDLNRRSLSVHSMPKRRGSHSDKAGM
jgi:hypothetical protein